jgi:Tfp pilus assembly protein, ATPase PilM
MDFLPTSLGTRPRLAVEIRSEGVVAARAENAAALLTAVSRADVAAGAVLPGFKTGNISDRQGVTAAVRKALDEISGKGSERSLGRHVTLVIPDAAVRVLLLDFDQLPSKALEALPVVRFRLKKLLPFDADTASVSYQVLASERSGVRVLAVAMPKDVLEEYESVVIAAGYLPGAVLPSTLAALSGLDTADAPVLVVNAEPGEVTTAIVKGGILLLHRALDLTANAEAAVSAAASVGESQSVWESPLPVESVDPGGYDRFDAEAAMQTVVIEKAERHDWVATAVAQATASEITQTISVAAAYFEDTLQVAPESLLVAGTIGAHRVAEMMEANGLEGLRVQEMVETAMLEAGAVSASVPRGWLAGVRGALKS